MVCPFCFHAKTKVYNSRSGERLNIIWRRRRCENCDAQFTTYESADPGTVLTVKNNNKIETFSHSKLLLSLLKVCAHRTDLDESIPYLAATIEQKLYKSSRSEKSISKQTIVAHALSTLKNFDPVAYVAYLSNQHQSLTKKQLRDALKQSD